MKKVRLLPDRLGLLGLLWLAAFLILTTSLFSELLKGANYTEIFPSELGRVALMHAVTALIIALTVYLAKRPFSALGKLVTTTILGLFMVNYDDRLQTFVPIARIFGLIPAPGGNDLAFISLVLLAGLVGLSLLAGTLAERLPLRSKLRAKDLGVAISLFIAIVFLSQFLPAVRMLPAMIRESHVQAPSLGQPKSTAATAKPDIYYIVLEDYASGDILKSQLGFDNSSFLNKLAADGYYLNNGARSNYPFTAPSVASTLSAGYIDKEIAPFVGASVQSHILYHNVVRQSPVIKALKAGGYRFYNLGTTYGTSDKAPLATQDFASNVSLSVFGKEVARLRGEEYSQFRESPYYRLTQVGLNWWPIKISEATDAAFLRSQLNTLDSLATDPHPGGRFIFVHILVPHPPYYYNPDGSLSTTPGADSNGKPIKQKYLDQIQFINSQMEDSVAKIQAHSGGQAVVIFNSDEGAHPNYFNGTFKNPPAIESSNDEVYGGDMLTWSNDWLQMKYGIFQAVHIPAATPEDLAHLSPVNLFRVVLNRYLGYDLGYLPDCQYALSKGNDTEYLYTNITKRLTGEPNKACLQYETRP